MLTITGDYPPLNTSESTVGAEVGTTGVSTVGAIGSEYQSDAGQPLQTSEVVIIEPDALGGESITLPLPTNIGTVTGVVIGGFSYTIQNYAIRNGNIVIPYSQLPNIPNAGTSAVVYGLSNDYGFVPTNQAFSGVPSWINRWNASGRFSVSREFASQPSGSFEFVTLASNEGDVRNELAPGERLLFSALCLGFTVESIQITRLSRLEYPQGLIQVSVSLTGYHVRALERKVKQGSILSGTLNGVAAASGVPYQGLAVPLNKSRNTPDDSYTTLQSELEAKALAAQGFVFYSSPGAVSIKTWGGTPIHYRSTANVLSEIQIALNGRKVSDTGGASAANPGGIGGDDDEPLILTNELENLQFEPDPNEEEIEQQQDAELWIEEADDFLFSPPDSITAESLKTTAQCFNNGGPTKERIRTLYKNGSILRQERDVWGLAFKSTQVHFITGDIINGRYQRRWEFSPVAPLSFWQKVEESVEIYSYDDLGYLTSIVKTGQKLAQFKQEQNNEALAAELITTITSNGVVIQDATKLRALFNFFWLSYKDTTTYGLKSMIGVYPDIEVSTEDDWIEPKYASYVQRKSFQQAVVENPVIDQQTQTKQPPIVTGQSRQELTRTTINYPPSFIRKEIYNSDYDQFATSQTTQNSEGSGMKDALKIGRRSENSGRVSTHTRLNRYRRRREPTQSQGAFGFNPQVTYLVNTPDSGYTTNDPPTGTISYESVFTPEQGRLAAEVQTSIENTFNVEQWQFELEFEAAKTLKEGDRLMLGGTLLVVRSVSHEFTIQQGFVTARSQVQAGKFLRPYVTLTTRSASVGLAV